MVMCWWWWWCVRCGVFDVLVLVVFDVDAAAAWESVLKMMLIACMVDSEPSIRCYIDVRCTFCEVPRVIDANHKNHHKIFVICDLWFCDDHFVIFVISFWEDRGVAGITKNKKKCHGSEFFGFVAVACNRHRSVGCYDLNHHQKISDIKTCHPLMGKHQIASLVPRSFLLGESCGEIFSPENERIPFSLQSAVTHWHTP